MKKLLNKRGSVLFLVVVIMAILLVAASATYYVVRNQHASATTHYSSEQSYQTALSVSENVSQYIDGVVKKIQTGNMSYDSTNIVNKMIGLTKNGASLDATPTDLSVDGLGEFKVEIVKVEQDGDSHTFDIITTAEVNGETVRLVMRKVIVLSAADTKYFTRFLTSTGRATAEDTILSAGDIFGVSYFENDYTRFTTGNTKIRDSVYSTGTLNDVGVVYSQIDPNKYTEIVVGGDFHVTSAAGSNVENLKCIYVGGNMSVGKNIKVDEVFVEGDLTIIQAQDGNTVFHVGGDCYNVTSSTTNNTFYIEGDLYLGDASTNWWNAGTFYVAGNVYVRNSGAINGYISYAGNVINERQGFDFNTQNNQGKNKNKSGNSINIEQVNSNAITSGYSYSHNNELSSWDNIDNYIYNSVAMGTYAMWDVETYYEKTFPDLLANAPVDLNPNSYTFQSVNGVNKADIKQPGTDNVIGEIREYGSPWAYYAEIRESCKLAPILNWGRDGSVLVIDATEHDIYVYLDGSSNIVNGKKTFLFSNHQALNILIKGSHSVIFLLPEDTNYKHATQCFIGHLGIAGFLETNRNNSIPTLNISAYSKPEDFLAVGLFGAVSNTNAPSTFKAILDMIEYDEDGTFLTGINTDAFGDIVVHNNIFFATRGKNNVLDFNVQSSFCGYLYAPNLTLECDGSYGGLQFFGGLIVGAYTYTNPSAILVFAAPYDPYNGHGSKVVTDLMSENNKYSDNANLPVDPDSGGVVIEIHNEGYR